MTDKPAAPAPECKCDLRTKLVGDGCEVCNPELAKELAAPAPDVPYAVWRQGWDAVEKWKAEAAAPAPDDATDVYGGEAINPAAPEPTRSQKLTAAGFTRRPTWRSLPKDDYDDEPAPDAATVDQIMALADEYGKKEAELRHALGVPYLEKNAMTAMLDSRAALRAAVERVIAENLQRGNVIGRIAAHLLGRQNNVSDEDVVIAAAEVGRELQGARERAERAEAGLVKANSQAEHFEREWYLRGDALERTEAERDALRAQYEELIYAVGNKYPNETRHETALRYIRQAEAGTGEASVAKDQP